MALYNARGNTVVSVSNTTGKGFYSADGAMRVTVCDGNSFVGHYAPDGSVNIVIVSSSSTPQGLYHPSGALRVLPTVSSTGYYAPNGALYVDGSSIGGYLDFSLSPASQYIPLVFSGI